MGPIKLKKKQHVECGTGNICCASATVSSQCFVLFLRLPMQSYIFKCSLFGTIWSSFKQKYSNHTLMTNLNVDTIYNLPRKLK